MKHLCIDARMLGACGIGTFLFNTIQALYAQKCFELTILCHPKYLQAFEGAKTVVATSSVYSILEQTELKKKIPKCDLFWSPHVNVPLLPIKAKKRLCTIHDTYHLEHKKSLSLKKRVAALLLYNGAFTLSDCVVTDSEFSKHQILKHALFVPRRLEVIAPGMDLEHFSPCLDPVHLNEVKKRYDLPEKFFLAVGNDRPHKNLKNLLLAYEKSRVRNCSLVIVGKQNGSQNALIDLMNRAPFLKKNTHFTGIVLKEDLPAIYSLATSLCFPSFYEGYGFPPLEAFACGCPVIASKSASLPEICGSAAHLIDPKDPSEIAQALTTLQDPKIRQNLITLGFAMAQKHCLKKSIQKTLSLLTSLL